MNISKNMHLLLAACLMLFASACDKNEILPDHAVVGESYATAVVFKVSNDEPVVGETVEVELSYANYSEDPVMSVTFLEQIGDGDRTTINTLDESGASLDAEIIRKFNYTIPDASDVYIYAEIRSNKEFPQIERVTMEVQ